MKYYAITINRSELTKDLKTIKSVENYLRDFCDVYVISVERNELNDNIHYHGLVKASENNDNFMLESSIWKKQLDNKIDILKYINYIKKEGNFKVYQLTELELEQGITWQEKAIQLVEKHDNIRDILTESPEMLKYINHIEKLFIHYKKK